VATDPAAQPTRTSLAAGLSAQQLPQSFRRREAIGARGRADFSQVGQ
jgi:hypothetical protein